MKQVYSIVVKGMMTREHACLIANLALTVDPTAVVVMDYQSPNGQVSAKPLLFEIDRFV